MRENVFGNSRDLVDNGLFSHAGCLPLPPSPSIVLRYMCRTSHSPLSCNVIVAPHLNHSVSATRHRDPRTGAPSSLSTDALMRYRFIFPVIFHHQLPFHATSTSADNLHSSNRFRVFSSRSAGALVNRVRCTHSPAILPPLWSND